MEKPVSSKKNIINQSQSISLLQNNRSLFFSLLSSFIEDFEESPSRITALLDSGSYEEAQRIVHTAKSLAGTLCAADLQTSARALEHALKNEEDYLKFLYDYDISLKRFVEQGALILSDNVSQQVSFTVEPSSYIPNRPTVLIVDDDARERLIIKNALENEFNILEAQNGLECIDIAKAECQNLDLILLDLTMPEMDGIKTCEAIKEIIAPFGIPIIIVTATYDFNTENQVFDVGAVDYIHKPINPETVLRRARTHIELKRCKQDLMEAVESRTRTMSKAVIELAKSSRIKDEFLSTVSHELRTPINGIVGALQMMKETKQLNSLDIAFQSTEQLQRQIENILIYSEAQSGNLVINNADFLLKDFTERSIKHFELSAEEKGLNLNQEIIISPDLEVRSDPVKTQIVMDHLIDNAVKFTDSGCINISSSFTEKTTDEEAQFVFAVEDQGPGFDVDHFTSPESCFLKADASFSRRHGGLGIGLAVCQSICQHLGATLSFDSTEKGTKCEFRLPINVFDTTRNKDKQFEIKPGTHVLVVEDNKVNQMVIKKLLTKLGCTVVTADDGSLALPLIENETLDCILMDCQMPIMDGFETTERIRASNSDNKDTPIIAVTANALSTDKQRCLDAGMNDYLTKPINIEALSKTMGYWLNQSSHNSPDASKKEVKVLVVEDNKQMQDLISLFVRRCGTNFDIACNGREAIEKVMNDEFSLILMDIEMPEMNGIDALLNLKQQGFKGIVYALTANDEPDEIKYYLDIGFDGFLPKPVNGKELASILSHLH